MKKFLLFYSIVHCSTILSAKDSAKFPAMDINGTVQANTNSHFRKSEDEPPYNANSLLSVVTFDSLRSIDEVNDLTAADAFPWISLDGLRLYYAHANLSNELFYSERPTINDLWTIPINMNIIGTCFTFSRNELELFACDGSDIIHYDRANLSSPFINPQIINMTLPGLPNLYRSVSFDPSGAQMFVYAYYTGYTKAYELTRNSQLLYNYTREITFPIGFRSSSGRLSVDGLTFYLTLSDTAGYYNLARMERPTPFDTFNVASTQFIPELIDSTNWNSHPCTSQNDEWIVFTKAISNSWSETNLFIASKAGVINSVSENMNLHATVFPNPASNSISFRLNKKVNGEICLKIFSVDGKLCRSQNYFGIDQITTDTEQFDEGIYFYSVTSKNTEFKGKFLIQR